jgi:hypothetical protein
LEEIKRLDLMVVAATEYDTMKMKMWHSSQTQTPTPPLRIDVRRKLPLPREPAGAILKEGTNLYWVAKLQGAVERQYSFYVDSCLVKIHVLLQ